MTTTDPTAGPQIVSGDYDEAGVNYDAVQREIEAREIEVRKMAAVDILDELRAVLGLSPGQPLTEAVTQLRDNLARLQSQLAEAREQRDQAAEALVRVAKTLGWDAPPEQVPSGIPDLAIAVQELRRQRDQARTALAEARQQRDHAAEALVRAETERDEALCAITKIAEALGFPGGNLCDAIRALKTERDEAREAQVQHATAMAAIEIIDDLRAVLGLSPGQPLTKAVTQLRDDLAWMRRQVLAVAEDLERYASDPRPEKLPMSERKLAWTLRQIVAGERPEACRCGKPAGHCSHCHDDPPAQTVADALDDAVGHLRDMLLRALATTAPETGPTAPQTGEHTGVRVETCTEPASARVDLVIGLRQRGIPQHPDGPEAAALAEIDRLRAALNSQGGSR